MHERPLAAISDDELLRRLRELLHQSHRVGADLVAHIGVDERHLYAREAMPSMFAYCTEVLHLTEAEAYLRITAARAAREHPSLLVLLADGRLHLSGIAKLERLEARRFAKTKSTRKAPSNTDIARVSRLVPAAVRRVVYERDKGQCRYVDRRGRRCPERHRLEYHHRRPYALGGDPSSDNICLLCRAHNQYMARHDYGPKAMSRNRRSEKRAPSVLLWTEGSLVSGPEDS
jgi:5-methylcytosine-specific restriction endonuclease McrA